jgi:hypothetical protein
MKKAGDLKQFRRDWSDRQKRLREFFKSGAEVEARELFFRQHAVFHSRDVSGKDTWSFADDVFSGLEEDLYRVIPAGDQHSLLWILWHISRIEDITMNILVAGGDQIYLRDGWKRTLGSPVDHTGNSSPEGDILKISSSLDPDKLLAYRSAVGLGTREVFKNTPASAWIDKVKVERLDRLIEEGAVLPEAEGLLAYWGKRRIFELFLMPPTRHLMSHLNESNRVKRKILNQAAKQA